MHSDVLQKWRVDLEQLVSIGQLWDNFKQHGFFLLGQVFEAAIVSRATGILNHVQFDAS